MKNSEMCLADARETAPGGGRLKSLPQVPLLDLRPHARSQRHPHRPNVDQNFVQFKRYYSVPLVYYVKRGCLSKYIQYKCVVTIHPCHFTTRSIQ